MKGENGEEKGNENGGVKAGEKLKNKVGTWIGLSGVLETFFSNNHPAPQLGEKVIYL